MCATDNLVFVLKIGAEGKKANRKGYEKYCLYYEDSKIN